MPSVTPKQKRTMQWVAHDPAASDKLGIPQSVARDYVAADKKNPAFCGGGKVQHYAAGGRVDRSTNPFATGGPMLPRSGHESRKP